MTNESFTTLGLSLQSDYQQWISTCNTGGSEGYVALPQLASVLETSMMRSENTVESALMEQALADFFSTGFIPNDLNNSGWAEQNPVSEAISSPAAQMARQKPTVKTTTERAATHWAIPQQPISNAPVLPSSDAIKEVGGNTPFNNNPSGTTGPRMMLPDPDESKQANSPTDGLAVGKTPANTHTAVDRSALNRVTLNFQPEPALDDSPKYEQPSKEMLRERSHEHKGGTNKEQNAQQLPFIQEKPSTATTETAFQPARSFSDWANLAKIGQAPNEPEQINRAMDWPEPASSDISGHQDRTIERSISVSADTMREKAETRNFSIEAERNPTFAENNRPFAQIPEYPALETTAPPPAINNSPFESPLNNPIQKPLYPEDILEALAKTLKEDYRRYYGYL